MEVLFFFEFEVEDFKVEVAYISKSTETHNAFPGGRTCWCFVPPINLGSMFLLGNDHNKWGVLKGDERHHMARE